MAMIYNNGLVGGGETEDPAEPPTTTAASGEDVVVDDATVDEAMDDEDEDDAEEGEGGDDDGGDVARVHNATAGDGGDGDDGGEDLLVHASRAMPIELKYDAQGRPLTKRKSQRKRAERTSTLKLRMSCVRRR